MFIHLSPEYLLVSSGKSGPDFADLRHAFSKISDVDNWIRHVAVNRVVDPGTLFSQNELIHKSIDRHP